VPSLFAYIPEETDHLHHSTTEGLNQETVDDAIERFGIISPESTEIDQRHGEGVDQAWTGITATETSTGESKEDKVECMVRMRAILSLLTRS
jgi:hypothetical protein